MEGLRRRRPEASAAFVLTAPQLAGLTVLAVALIYAFYAAPRWSALALHVTAWALFALAGVTRFSAACAALQAPPPQRPGWRGPLPIYTILCPLYREARIVQALVTALDRLDYPRALLDIKLVLEQGDGPTIAAARHWARGRPIEVVVVPPGGPQTKPRALNYALARARGQFVTVYDAEDAPAPEQLREALDAFAADPALSVAQAPLLIHNARESWISGQFATEYALQFGAILPLFARLGLPFPLGGTSNHFRVAALRLAGGWDPYNVTEDADIGYRLAMDGWRMTALTAPTLEEAPTSMPAWIRQRSRWIKGHIQTWLVLMRRPGRTLDALGLRGFLAMQLLLGGGIAAAFVHAPMAFTLAFAAFAPEAQLAAWDWGLAAFGYGTAIAAALLSAALGRDGRMARAALTMPLYWPLTTVAAVRALIELLVRPHYWAKTNHGWRAGA